MAQLPAIRDRLQELTRPTGEEDLLAVDYPRPRVHIPVAQAVIVVVVCVVALVAWLGLSARGPQEAGLEEFDVALAPVESSAAHSTHSPTIEGEAAAANAAQSTEIVVSVVGHVRHAGLVKLGPGARVADALAQAGPLPDADLLSLNQAQLLNDGEQIVVGVEGQEPSGMGVAGGSSHMSGQSAAGENAPGTVNLNTATQSELETLSGVGAVTAANIIAHRESIGSFTSVDQLLDVSGIGPAKLAQLEGQVSV